MNTTKQQFIKHLHSLDFKFIEHDNHIELILSGSSLKFNIVVFFGSGYTTSVASSPFNVNEKKLPYALNKINEINTKIPCGHLEIATESDNNIVAKYGVNTDELTKPICDDLLFLSPFLIEAHKEPLSSLMQ